LVIEDRNHPSEWRVEYQEDDGGCYLTIFAGPEAERRARGYWQALQSGRVKTDRAARSDLQ
jgi:hypothetical protein